MDIWRASTKFGWRVKFIEKKPKLTKRLKKPVIYTGICASSEIHINFTWNSREVLYTWFSREAQLAMYN